MSAIFCVDIFIYNQSDTLELFIYLFLVVEVYNVKR